MNTPGLEHTNEGQMGEQQVQCTHKCTGKEDSFIVEKTMFGAFICKVSDEATKPDKSHQIMTAVKAANEHLDIQKVTVEDLHEMLTVVTDGSSQGHSEDSNHQNSDP